MSLDSLTITTTPHSLATKAKATIVQDGVRRLLRATATSGELGAAQNLALRAFFGPGASWRYHGDKIEVRPRGAHQWIATRKEAA